MHLYIYIYINVYLDWWARGMQETSGKRIQQQTTFWAERVLCGLLYIKKCVGFSHL